MEFVVVVVAASVIEASFEKVSVVIVLIALDVEAAFKTWLSVASLLQAHNDKSMANTIINDDAFFIMRSFFLKIKSAQPKLRTEKRITPLAPHKFAIYKRMSK